jgi:hypothetical protein
MPAIRATFDGKAFVPDRPVKLPRQSSAIVIVKSRDKAAQAAYDRAIREYYESTPDADDDWPEELQKDLKRAWDEE